jgi:hypothetical protein
VVFLCLADPRIEASACYARGADQREEERDERAALVRVEEMMVPAFEPLSLAVEAFVTVLPGGKMSGLSEAIVSIAKDFLFPPGSTVTNAEVRGDTLYLDATLELQKSLDYVKISLTI